MAKDRPSADTEPGADRQDAQAHVIKSQVFAVSGLHVVGSGDMGAVDHCDCPRPEHLQVEIGVDHDPSIFIQADTPAALPADQELAESGQSSARGEMGVNGDPVQ